MKTANDLTLVTRDNYLKVLSLEIHEKLNGRECIDTFFEILGDFLNEKQAIILTDESKQASSELALYDTGHVISR